MINKGIDRILQIIERVENSENELILEHNDTSNLEGKYFNGDKGEIYTDKEFKNLFYKPTVIAFATDEVKNSNSRNWDKQSNFWVIKYSDKEYVIQVSPEWSATFSEEERERIKEYQKTGSGLIERVWLIERL